MAARTLRGGERRAWVATATGAVPACVMSSCGSSLCARDIAAADGPKSDRLLRVRGRDTVMQQLGELPGGERMAEVEALGFGALVVP